MWATNNLDLFYAKYGRLSADGVDVRWAERNGVYYLMSTQKLKQIL